MIVQEGWYWFSLIASAVAGAAVGFIGGVLVARIFGEP